MEIKELIDWMDANKEWLFSGLGIAIISILWKFISGSEKKKIAEQPSVQNENNVTVNVNTENKIDDSENLIESKKYSKLKDLKNNINILFIDDDTKFKVVNILKNAGYNNVKIIKDIKAIDTEDVEKADIFFIDIQGVGKRMDFKDEGLGLAEALMDKYKKKKKYIIYSAETQGDRFNEALRKADDFLAKDADPYQFESIIEKFFLEER